MTGGPYPPWPEPHWPESGKQRRDRHWIWRILPSFGGTLMGTGIGHLIFLDHGRHLLVWVMLIAGGSVLAAVGLIGYYRKPRRR